MVAISIVTSVIHYVPCLKKYILRIYMYIGTRGELVSTKFSILRIWIGLILTSYKYVLDFPVTKMRILGRYLSIIG